MRVTRAVIEKVAAEFAAGGEVTIERHARGHIHDTWFVTTRYDDLVLQRLNDRVFGDCILMMDNVVRVVGHLRNRARRRRLPDPERRVLSTVRARGGKALVFDQEGKPWRAFHRVERAASHNVVTTPEMAFQIGRTFGMFLEDVQDLPGPLREPIPGFKDFVRRRKDFEFVVDADAFDRVRTSQAEIEGVRRHHSLVDRLVEAQKGRLLRRRTVHNDAKANNVLLDVQTGEGLCVIDLDTVGPGTVLFDVGDLLRTATVSFPEDGEDAGSGSADDTQEATGDALADIAVRDDLLEAAIQGYLREAGLILSPDELDLLPLAGPLMAYENAMRFLTDHLVGDTYYRISRPRQNLDRARTQLRVLEALTTAQDRVAELVARSL